MKYHISVTAEDIIRGQCSSAHYCPIALAATRTFFGREVTEETMFAPERVAVTFEVRVYRGDLMEKGYLPQEAREFIDVFDRGGRLNLRPFEFDVEVQ